MKTNSDEALILIGLLTRPPSHLSPLMVTLLKDLSVLIESIDKENLRLRQEVQMLRAVLEQEKDKVC